MTRLVLAALLAAAVSAPALAEGCPGKYNDQSAEQPRPQSEPAPST